MNEYEISYRNFDVDRVEYPRGKRETIGTIRAKNGLDAIRETLRLRGVDANEIAVARTFGSNKRLYLYGVAFEATKR